MKPTVPRDRMGKPIEVGAFCVYVLHHAFGHKNTGHSGADLFWGHVTHIGRTGKIKCTNIKLHANDPVEEKEVKHSCMIMQIDGDPKNAIMLHKLSA